MIYALAHPTALVGLILGYLVGAVLRGSAQAVTGARLGAPEGRLRRRPHLRLHIDPFSAVAAALSGVGWAARAPLPVPARRGAIGGAVAVTAVGIGVSLLLAAVGLAVFVATGGTLSSLAGLDISSAVHGNAVVVGNPAGTVALAFAVENLAMALLTLVPMPPTEVGRIVAGRLRSPGWRRAAYRLDEENWGVAVLLLLLLLPLGNQPPPLLAVLDVVGRAIFNLIGG